MGLEALNLSRARSKFPLRFLIASLLLGGVISAFPLPVSLLLLFCVGVLLFSLFEPLVALAVTLLAAPFGALENVVLGNTILESGQWLFLLTIGIWLAHSVVRREIKIPRFKISIPLLLFLAAAALSLLDANSFASGLKEVAKWLEVGLVMIVVIDLSTADTSTISAGDREIREQRIRKSIWLIVAMLLLAAFTQTILGVWQFGIRGDGPSHFAIMDGYYRAYGSFQQPNPYGGYMAMSATLALGVFLGLFWKRWKGRGDQQTDVVPMWAIVLSGTAAIALTVGLVVSWSRGAWLGFGAAAAVMLLYLPRKRPYGVLLLILAILLLAAGVQLGILPQSITSRIESFQQDFNVVDVRGVEITSLNFSVVERLAHWQAGLEMARDNFWTGVGFGSYEDAYGEYALMNWPAALGHAHNYYINIMAETGVIGAAAYVLLWLAILIQSFRLLGRAEWPYRGIILGLLGAWIVLSTHHLVDKLYVNNIYLAMGVMLGLQQVLEEYDG